MALKLQSGKGAAQTRPPLLSDAVQAGYRKSAAVAADVATSLGFKFMDSCVAVPVLFLRDSGADV